jgi:hypothetical protein
VAVSQSEDKHEEEKEKCQNKWKDDFQKDKIEKESGSSDRSQEDTSNTLAELEDTGNSTKHKIKPPIQREETLNMTEKSEKTKKLRNLITDKKQLQATGVFNKMVVRRNMKWRVGGNGPLNSVFGSAEA